MSIVFVVWFLTMIVLVQSKTRWVRSAVIPLLIIPFSVVAWQWLLGLH